MRFWGRQFFTDKFNETLFDEHGRAWICSVRFLKWGCVKLFIFILHFGYYACRKSSHARISAEPRLYETGCILLSPRDNSRKECYLKSASVAVSHSPIKPTPFLGIRTFAPPAQASRMEWKNPTFPCLPTPCRKSRGRRRPRNSLLRLSTFQPKRRLLDGSNTARLS